MTRVSDLTATWAAGVLNRDYGHPQERENARLLMASWRAQTTAIMAQIVCLPMTRREQDAALEMQAIAPLLGTLQQLEAQTRTITCKECHGDGGWEADERVYGYRECTACAGRGEIEIVEP